MSYPAGSQTAEGEPVGIVGPEGTGKEDDYKRMEGLDLYLPRYSTEIKDAWEVWEWLKGQAVEVERAYRAEGKDCFALPFLRLDVRREMHCCGYAFADVQGEEDYLLGIGRTEAESICRCALKVAERLKAED